MGGQKDDIPRITAPGGITIITNPPKVTSGADDNDTKGFDNTVPLTLLDVLTRAPSIVTDSDGRPAATHFLDIPTSSTEGESLGHTKAVLKDPGGFFRVILVDVNGHLPVTTAIEKSSSSLRPQSDSKILTGAVAETLFDSHGVHPSTRVVVTTPPRPWATTLSRSGVPWTTVTANSSGPTYIPYLEETVYAMTKWQYFIGKFLPTLITTAVSMPIRMLERNAMLLYPFHALASPKGSLGSESILVNTGTFSQRVTTVLNPSRDKVLLLMATTLVLTSTVVTALSGEAVGISLHGCEKISRDLTNCAMSLSVFPAAAKVTLVLLVFLVLGIFFIILLLRRWQSGVPTNPWSLGSMVILSSHAGTRGVVMEAPAASQSASEETKSAVIGTRVFRLHQARIEATPLKTDSIRCEETPPCLKSTFVEPNSRCHSPGHFTTLTPWDRLLFFAFLGGILSMVTYYQSGYWANGFEDFMAGYSFGVRFLFTSIGIGINFFWGSFFSGVSTLSPFQLLASAPREARHSILLGPSNDPFSGLWTGIRRRHGFLAITAFTACLAEFLPVLLGNVPSNASQTQNTHINSTWATIAVLAFMVLVLLGSFAARWPPMPADPTSIVGMMHYVVDSPALLDNLDRLGVLRKRERDRRVQERGLRYGFGPMKGISGQTRIGVYVMDRKVASGQPTQAC